MRYEAYRADQNCRDWMFGKQFKDIYRNFNIRMSVEDQKFVYEFLKMERNPVETDREDNESTKFDLNSLAKIVDALSKDYYVAITEKFDFPERPNREK